LSELIITTTVTQLLICYNLVKSSQMHFEPNVQ